MLGRMLEKIPDRRVRGGKVSEVGLYLDYTFNKTRNSAQNTP